MKRKPNSNLERDKRFGINLKGLSPGVRIEGCTIEGNPGCGIFVSAWIDALDIVANYFEVSAAADYTFAHPARTVKAQIVITGSQDSTTVNSSISTASVARPCAH